jgi:hypothetical protein
MSAKESRGPGVGTHAKPSGHERRALLARWPSRIAGSSETAVRFARSPVAQLVERLTVNQEVAGSSPARGANYYNYFCDAPAVSTGSCGRGRRRRRRRVGGHLFGRICRRVAPPPGGPHGEPGGLEVGPGGLAPHARRRFNAAQRPAQLPEGNDLPLLRVAQDVRHAGGGAHSPTAASTSERLLPMAGFQLSIYGRFWVSTEGCSWARGRGYPRSCRLIGRA